MEKLEDITHSMRQWVERIGPIPSHEIVASVFDWARRIEACKNEVKHCINAAGLRQALIAIAYRNVAGKPTCFSCGYLTDTFNAYWPPYGIATTGIAIGTHLKAGDGWCVAIYSVLCLLCIGVTMTRILEKDESD